MTEVPPLESEAVERGGGNEVGDLFWRWGDGAGLSDWGLLAGLRFLVGYASGVPFGAVS